MIFSGVQGAGRARMEASGMQASADDIDTVIDYLSKALPPR